MPLVDARGDPSDKRQAKFLVSRSQTTISKCKISPLIYIHLQIGDSYEDPHIVWDFSECPLVTCTVLHLQTSLRKLTAYI